MQRKNDFLVPTKSTLGSTLSSREHFSAKNIPYAQAKRNRSGFAMIMAVVVMIVVATIMAFTLNQTTQTAKRTADMYLYEQTELHAKSAIEYALFRIAENNTSAGCLNNIPPFLIDNMYDVNITMRYVFNGGVGGCNNYISTLAANEQNGSVLMDVRISVDGANGGTEPITYFRRTIQKL